MRAVRRAAGSAPAGYSAFGAGEQRAHSVQRAGHAVRERHARRGACGEHGAGQRAVVQRHLRSAAAGFHDGDKADQRFISQINRGDLTIREAEDIDETTLSYAEIKAITAANPKIKRKMEVDAEVARLCVLEGQYRKNLYELQDKIYKKYPEEIRKQELLIERIGKDLEMLKTRRPADPEAFEISVNGTIYTDKKEGGNGEDLRHNHSNSDMSLMNYLAFYSGGNVEQMTRILATSGLYRPDKPASYYEYTAIKAAKDTPHYTPPRASNAAPKAVSGGNGKA